MHSRLSFSKNRYLAGPASLTTDPSTGTHCPIKRIAFLLVSFFWAICSICTMGCGNGAPSDAQITKALRQDFKKLERTALAFTEADLQDIRIHEKMGTDVAGTYTIQVTATVATRIGGINTVRPCSTTITMKKANNRWTLVD